MDKSREIDNKLEEVKGIIKSADKSDYKEQRKSKDYDIEL